MKFFSYTWEEVKLELKNIKKIKYYAHKENTFLKIH